MAGLNSKPRATDSHAASLPPAAPEPLTTDTAPEPEEEAALVPDPVAENAPTATQSASDMPPVRRNPLPSTRGRPGPASRPLELTVVRPFRHLSFSPCSLQLYDPCRGRAGALHACSHIKASLWGVEGAPHTCHHQRGLRVFSGRRMRLPAANTPCTTTLLTALHAPLPSPHSSVSTLQLRQVEQPPHPVQAVGATVPPSAAHTGGWHLRPVRGTARWRCSGQEWRR